MFVQDQKQLPKYRFQLGVSDDVIMYLNEDEQSVRNKVDMLKIMGAISHNIQPIKIAETKFSISLKKYQYTIFQELFSYPESENSQSGFYGAKQFTFSNIDRAIDFFQCLNNAGFRLIGEIDIFAEVIYIVRITQEYGKIFDCFLPCFVNQGSVDNYLALEEFYTNVLDKHKGILENVDLSNNELVKELNKIFMRSIPREEKLITLWKAINEFKKLNESEHTQVIPREVASLFEDIKKLSELEVDMSLSKEDLEKQLTLEPRKNADEHDHKKAKFPLKVLHLEDDSPAILKETDVVKKEKTALETFFDTPRKLVDDRITTYREFLQGSDDILQVALSKVLSNEKISDEDKVESMKTIISGFAKGGILGANRQSYMFIVFSDDLNQFAIPADLTQLAPNEPVAQLAPSSSNSTPPNGDLIANNLHTTFGQRQPETPTEYQVQDEKKILVKRTFDEMKKTDAPNMENENNSEKESECANEAKKPRLANG